MLLVTCWGHTLTLNNTLGSNVVHHFPGEILQCRLPIEPFSLTDPFNPTFILINSQNHPVFLSSAAIYQQFLLLTSKEWGEQEKLRSQVFSITSAYPTQFSLLSLPSTTQNFAHRATLSYLPTKKRIVEKYKSKLQSTTTYDNHFFDLCKNIQANHEHILSKCPLAQAIDHIAAQNIHNILKDNELDHLPIWLPNIPRSLERNSQIFHGFNKKYAIRGLVPPNLSEALKSSNSSLFQKLLEISILAAKAKWVAHCLITHNKSLSMTDILNNQKIKRLLQKQP